MPAWLVLFCPSFAHFLSLYFFFTAFSISLVPFFFIRISTIVTFVSLFPRDSYWVEQCLLLFGFAMADKVHWWTFIIPWKLQPSGTINSIVKGRLTGQQSNCRWCHYIVQRTENLIHSDKLKQNAIYCVDYNELWTCLKVIPRWKWLYSCPVCQCSNQTVQSTAIEWSICSQKKIL